MSEKKEVLRKIAYTITGDKGREFWNKVGVAFVHEKSIQVNLFAMPLSGKIVLVDPKEKKEEEQIQA